MSGMSGMRGMRPAAPRDPADDPFDPANAVAEVAAAPDRIVLFALEGWGKTSFAAQAEDAIFLMTRGEDGLQTLMRTGQLRATKHFARPAESWLDLQRAVRGLAVRPHSYQSFVLDVLNGAERLCFDHVCQQSCDNDWAKFDAYGRGPKLAIPEFGGLLGDLDNLRNHGMQIILLCHSQVKGFKNPDGADYDRWEPALTKETWLQVKGWADMILFGTFETFTEVKKEIARKEGAALAKGKARGGQTRLLKTCRTAAYDGKNRHGLPEEIDCGDCPEIAWANFQAALHPQPAE